MILFLTPAVPRVEYTKPRYQQIVAVLADASLQAAVNYRTVVYPRVKRILEEHPSCVSAMDLRELLQRVPVARLLNWQDAGKIHVFTSLLQRLEDDRINTVEEVSRWIATHRARQKLLSIRGVGEKTVDYLAMLCGREAVPMDRHLFRFLALAGVERKRLSYVFARELFVQSCLRAGIDLRSAERQIWLLMRACS